MLLADLLRNAKGMGSAIRAVAQPMLGDIPAGLSGLGTMMLTGDMDKAAENTRAVQEQFAYEPNERGSEYLGALGAGINKAKQQALRVPGVAAGAEKASEGWEKFTQVAPGAAAITAGVVGAGIPEARAEGAVARATTKAEARALAAAEKKAAKEAERAAKLEAAEAAQRADRPGLINREIREMTAAEPDIGESSISRANERPKSGVRNEEGVLPKRGVEQKGILAALRQRKKYRSEPNTTPGADASDAEWAAWGDLHGVNMTRTPGVGIGIKDQLGKDIMIPGGFEGRFTIPDLFEMKANNFDPNLLPKELHDKLMQKFVRTHNIEAPDEVDIFNRLIFAQLSPNAPLLPNEFLAQRFRVRDIDELRKLAARGEEKGLANKLIKESGVGGAYGGGMGVKGTADLSNMSELAQLVLARPDMFKAGPGETLRDVTMRVMNQVKGLGPKTASLGVPWLDLLRANTSAVDLHMIRNNFNRLLNDPEVGPAFTERMAKKLKVENTPEAVQAALDAEDAAREAAEAAGKKIKPKAEKAAIDIVGGSSRTKVYRDAKTGELNPEVPASLAPDRLAKEPESAQDFNEFYQRIVDYVDESRGQDPLLELFPEQWRLWDRYRKRVEPHEFAHPDFRKLPRQSWSEMQAALQANKDAGFVGEGAQRAEARGPDWRKLYYGKADPALLAALAGGGAAAAAAPVLMNNDKNKARREALRK